MRRRVALRDFGSEAWQRIGWLAYRSDRRADRGTPGRGINGIVGSRRAGVTSVRRHALEAVHEED